MNSIIEFDLNKYLRFCESQNPNKKNKDEKSIFDRLQEIDDLYYGIQSMLVECKNKGNPYDIKMEILKKLQKLQTCINDYESCDGINISDDVQKQNTIANMKNYFSEASENQYSDAILELYVSLANKRVSLYTTCFDFCKKLISDYIKTGNISSINITQDIALSTGHSFIDLALTYFKRIWSNVKLKRMSNGRKKNIQKDIQYINSIYDDLITHLLYDNTVQLRKEYDGYIDDIFRKAGWFKRFFFGDTVAERGYFIGTLAETAREKINDFDIQSRIEHFNVDLGKPRIAEKVETLREETNHLGDEQVQNDIIGLNSTNNGEIKYKGITIRRDGLTYGMNECGEITRNPVSTDIIRNIENAVKSGELSLSEEQRSTLVKAKENIEPEGQIHREDFQKVAEGSLQERIETARDLIMAQKGEKQEKIHNPKGE